MQNPEYPIVMFFIIRKPYFFLSSAAHLYSGDVRKCYCHVYSVLGSLVQYIFDSLAFSVSLFFNVSAQT